jgi:predicted transcriptional regulator
METAIDDLLNKVRLIAETPRGELLRQIVDLMYEIIAEEYDTEPLTEEDLEAIRRGEEDLKEGRFITLEELDEKYGL